MKKSELKALIREVVEEVTAKKVPSQPMNEKAIIQDFLSSLMKKYPSIYAELDKTEDYPEIPNEYRINIGSDYIVQVLRRPNGNFVLKNGKPVFYLDAAYLSDEKGKRNLTKDEMINAIGTLPDLDI